MRRSPALVIVAIVVIVAIAPVAKLADAQSGERGGPVRHSCTSTTRMHVPHVLLHDWQQAARGSMRSLPEDAKEDAGTRHT